MQLSYQHIYLPSYARGFVREEQNAYLIFLHSWDIVLRTEIFNKRIFFLILSKRATWHNRHCMEKYVIVFKNVFVVSAYLLTVPFMPAASVSRNYLRQNVWCHDDGFRQVWPDCIYQNYQIGRLSSFEYVYAFSVSRHHVVQWVRPDDVRVPARLWSLYSPWSHCLWIRLVLCGEHNL